MSIFKKVINKRMEFLRILAKLKKYFLSSIVFAALPETPSLTLVGPGDDNFNTEDTSEQLAANLE